MTVWTVAHARRALAVPYLKDGRSWLGWDCWGVVVVAGRDLFGLQGLPDVPDPPQGGLAARASAFADHARAWDPVAVADACPGDVVLFGQGRAAVHCGLIVAPGVVLHAEAARGTLAEALARPLSIGLCALGAYRWAGARA